MTSFTGGFPAQCSETPSICRKHVRTDRTPTNLSPSTERRHGVGNDHHSAFAPNPRRATSFAVNRNDRTAVNNVPSFCPYSSNLNPPHIQHPIPYVGAPSSGNGMSTVFPDFFSHAPLVCPPPITFPFFTARHFIFPHKFFRYSSSPMLTSAMFHHTGTTENNLATYPIARARGGLSKYVREAAHESGQGGETSVDREELAIDDEAAVVSAESSGYNSRDSNTPINVCD